MNPIDHLGDVLSEPAAESLWTCLHDAEVQGIRSDALSRTVVLALHVGYLRETQGLPDLVRFAIELSGVTSVSVARFVAWPGPAPDLQGKSYQEQSQAWAVERDKGRRQSVDWAEFELFVDAHGFEVSDADLWRGPTQVSLRIEGMLNDEDWCEVHIRAAALTVTRSDGVDLGLAEFRRWGEVYWAAFAARA